MNNEIVAIYCLCDDILKAMNHRDDVQRQMSDAEVMTTAIVSVQDLRTQTFKMAVTLCSPFPVPLSPEAKTLIFRFTA